MEHIVFHPFRWIDPDGAVNALIDNFTASVSDFTVGGDDIKSQPAMHYSVDHF